MSDDRDDEGHGGNITWKGRAVYGLILFVVLFTQFQDLQSIFVDALHVPARGPKGELLKNEFDEPAGLPAVRWMFYACTAGAALAVTGFEVAYLKGLAGVLGFFRKRDPVPPPQDAECEAPRFATRAEVPAIRRLAVDLYGSYEFTLDDLYRWHDANPFAFVVVMCGGGCVGYVDGFPISRQDFARLATGEAEKDVTPLAPGNPAIDEESAFYVASYVVARRYRPAQSEVLLNGALKQFGRAYPSRPWRRLCAIAASDAGRQRIEAMGMTPVRGATRVPIYELDRAAVAETPHAPGPLLRLFGYDRVDGHVAPPSAGPGGGSFAIVPLADGAPLAAPPAVRTFAVTPRTRFALDGAASTPHDAVQAGRPCRVIADGADARFVSVTTD